MVTLLGLAPVWYGITSMRCNASSEGDNGIKTLNRDNTLRDYRPRAQIPGLAVRAKALSLYPSDAQQLYTGSFH